MSEGENSEMGKIEVEFFKYLMDIPLVNYIWESVKAKYEEAKKCQYSAKIIDFLEGIVKDGFEKLKPYLEGPTYKTVDSSALSALKKIEEIFPVIMKSPNEIKDAVISYSLDFSSITEIGAYARVVFITSKNFVDECINFAYSFLEHLVDYFLPPLENEEKKSSSSIFGRTYNLFEKISLRIDAIGKSATGQNRTAINLNEIPIVKLASAFWAIPLVIFYEFAAFLLKM